MKKKIVVKIPLGSEESCREALKLAVKVHGVASATLDKDKDQITIIGEDVDPMAVAKSLKGGSAGKLRKFLGCVWPHHDVGSVNLVTVEDVKEEKKPEEKKPEEKKTETLVGHPYWYGGPPVIQVVEGAQPGGCWW